MANANADEAIGKIVADAMGKVGKYGAITIEEGKSPLIIAEDAEGEALPTLGCRYLAFPRKLFYAWNSYYRKSCRT